jgi:hypothetical protein
MAPVWLFVPNLIGYLRVGTGLAAFYYAFTDPEAFFLLYGFSYALDAVDGVAARSLGQKSSFGAVLDMVTDRFCTAGLLAVLAALTASANFTKHPSATPAGPWLGFVFLSLMVLDVVSHWVQMYRCAAQRWWWWWRGGWGGCALSHILCLCVAQLPDDGQRVAQGGGGRASHLEVSRRAAPSGKQTARLSPPTLPPFPRGAGSTTPSRTPCSSCACSTRRRCCFPTPPSRGTGQCSAGAQG